jgi:hypothetical protein
MSTFPLEGIWFFQVFLQKLVFKGFFLEWVVESQ